MWWGIEFRETNNCMFSVSAEFIVARESGERDDKLYKLYHGPILSHLEVMGNDGGWTNIPIEGDFERAVEKILPSNYGYNWTWESFMIALTFWEEGQKVGYYRGEDAERQRQRRVSDVEEYNKEKSK